MEKNETISFKNKAVDEQQASQAVEQGKPVEQEASHAVEKEASKPVEKAESAFIKLGLPKPMVKTLEALGYEQPTPIQSQSIPTLLGGRDILAQAQTGTGKTAAFALPALAKIDLAKSKPQVMVVAPTRELAIQVAEAFQSYAKHLKGFHVLPIYGGQDYRVQLRALKRGVHVVVGTPGRVMDHMRQGTLDMSEIKQIILDEADEMLKMGFIDDVEWILAQIPHKHQTALFSATLPPAVAKISSRYLNNPEKILIKANAQTVSTIEQFCIDLPNRKKLDTLTRILEIEDMDASIVFVRTRNLSSEVAEKLQARGYQAAPLNGDMNQSLREKVIGRLKSGSLDIVVATDVAARGIDVERVTHVFNYDIPHDVEAYIHRIGRTGRAGRKGKAILFVTQREGRLLRDIERVTKTVIKSMEPPTHKELFEKRNEQLVEQTVTLIKEKKNIKRHEESIERIAKEADCTVEVVAQALAFILQGKQSGSSEPTISGDEERSGRREYSSDRGGNGRGNSRGGSRGDSRGGSRGDSRGGNRGDSRGGNRGDSRGGNRGDSRGDSRGGSRGDSRDGSRGDSRSSSRGDSRDSRDGSRGDSRDSSRGDSRSSSRGDSRDSRDGARGDSRGSSRGDSRDSRDGSRGGSKSSGRANSSNRHDGSSNSSRPPSKKGSFNPGARKPKR